jgi:ribosomal protein S18 acetylase RimI-like enzyme
MPAVTLIREFQPRDVKQVEECLGELLDFCKAIDPLTASGKPVATKYLKHLLAECTATDGKIFVAETDNRVIGMVCIFARVPSKAPDEEAHEYAYVSDLVVLASDRNKGLGRALLRRAEEYAQMQGARLLRIGVHAPNKVARDLYIDEGFQERIVSLQKRLRTD